MIDDTEPLEDEKEYTSGKTLKEKCQDDLDRYWRELDKWKTKRKQTRELFDGDNREREILAKVKKKIRFYRRLIVRTNRQRNEFQRN